MKKIIKGKLYDTDKAKLLGADGGNYGSFDEWHEKLYQKRTGEFFLYGEGGPRTRYAHSVGENMWSGGSMIIPLSVETAREWVEAHLDTEQYETIFGLPDENAEPAVLNINIPAKLMAQIKANAAEQGKSITAYVTETLTAAIKYPPGR